MIFFFLFQNDVLPQMILEKKVFGHLMLPQHGVGFVLLPHRVDHDSSRTDRPSRWDTHQVVN